MLMLGIDVSQEATFIGKLLEVTTGNIPGK
jgi:hypothetical protein